MQRNMSPEDFKKEIETVIKEALEKVAMSHYRGDIKGLLVISIEKDNIFRITEAYGSDTHFAMSIGLDFAKDNLKVMIARAMMPAPEKD